MAKASYFQGSFLSGEWTPLAQGRADDPEYKQGLNVCLNGMPIEEGAWNRRSGTETLGVTKNGFPGRTLSFAFNANDPYDLILTPGHARFITDTGGYLLDLNPQAITGISTAKPAVITTAGTHGWNTGDSVVFLTGPASQLTAALLLCNREFQIQVLSTTTFAIYDPITNQPFDGSTITWVNNPGSVGRITDFTTVWGEADIPNVVLIQSQDQAILVDGAHPPQKLVATEPSATQDAVFTLGAAILEDGPYDDFIGNLAQLTWVTGSEWNLTYPTWASTTNYNYGDTVVYSGTRYQSLSDTNSGNTPSSSPTFWASTTGYPGVNDGLGFQASDIGRMVRIWSEPVAWASGTAYVTGNYVTYNNAYYQAIANSTGAEPDTSPTSWEAVVGNTQVASWLWGEINAVNSATQMTVFDKGGTLTNGGTVQPITQWALGLYTGTSYPSSGCFHLGRFYLAGAQPNRIDGTEANEPAATLSFAPSEYDSTVTDDNAVAFPLEADDANTIYWCIPDHQGVVMGTKGGEWSIQASNLTDPITPTSIQAHRNSKYGCADVQPRRTGLSISFVQRGSLKLLEYIADVYSGKYSASNLTKRGKHLTKKGIKEIAYQEEKWPCIWALTNDGQLIGVTYRRESPFATQPASIVGWHRHTLGSGRTVLSISSGGTEDGNTDTLTLVTQDPTTLVCYVERMHQMFDEDDTIQSGWFVDGGLQPAGASYITGSPDKVRLYGLGLMAGQTVDVVAGGVDMGSFTVTTGGTVDVPVGQGTSLLTKAWLESLSADGVGTPIIWGGGPPVSKTNTSLEYINTHSEGDTVFMPDFKRRLVWTAWQYSGTGIGECRVRVYNMDTQAELAEWDSGSNLWNYGDAASTPGTLDAATGDWCLMGGDANGHYSLMRFHYNAALGTVYPMRQSDVTVNAVNNPYRAWNGTSPYTPVVPVHVGVYTYQAIPSNPSGLSTAYIAVIDTNTGFQVCPSYGISEKYPFVAPGPANTFYSAGQPASATTYLLAFYKHVVIGASLETTTLGHITAANIHSGWANSDAVSIIGFSYDQTDGNLIGLFINSTQSQTYLAKINVQGTAAFVEWSTASTYAPSTSEQITLNNITAGRLNYNYGSNMYTVDTTNGSISSVASGYTGLNTVISDDTTGEVYWRATQNWFTNGLNSGQQNFGGADEPPFYTPFCIGTAFTSQGQLLRPLSPQDTGAQNGPALGKTRRTHMLAMLFNNAQGVSWGTDFVTMHPCAFASDGGTAYTKLQLYSGVYWDTLEDTYTFNSQPAWEITRPYPCTVCAVEAFIQTEDR
jgi:hypothetical protein